MTMQDATLLIGRLLLVVLYVVSGLGKWGDLSGTAATIAGKGFPLPYLCAMLAATLEVAGALAIAFGVAARPTAAALFAYTLVTAFIFHAFWGLPDEAAAKMQSLNFMKNLGLAGGLLMLAGMGAGRFALMRPSSRLSA
jgi:putative oxidoreductase